MTVEIINYESMKRGKCKGIFTVLFKKAGFEIRSCTWFISNGKRWFNFPSSSYMSDGEKKYYPTVALINREHEHAVNKAVMEALIVYFASHPDDSPDLEGEEYIETNDCDCPV